MLYMYINVFGIIKKAVCTVYELSPYLLKCHIALIYITLTALTRQSMEFNFLSVNCS